MKRIGYWDEVAAGFTWQGRERTLLNQIVDQENVDIGNLQAQVQALTGQLQLMRTVVTVLVNTLRDTKAVDPDVLDARLQAAIDSEASAAGATVCIQCKRQVEPRDTTMTENGPMCDRCSAAWLPNP